MFELDVTEIGPSLKWATATVNKASRTNTTTGAPKTEDPWGAAPAAGSDEPPF